MKSLRTAGIPALLVFCVGMALGQDVAHDVDKAAAKTGRIVKHGGKTVARGTKSGVKDVGNGTKVVAKGAAKGVKDTAHGTKVVAKDSAKGVKQTSKKTGEGIKDVVSK